MLNQLTGDQTLADEVEFSVQKDQAQLDKGRLVSASYTDAHLF